MNKINGYTEEEAKRLVEYVKDGKAAGKTLTAAMIKERIKQSSL